MYRRDMWRVACAVALLCVVTASDDDKRAELQPAPFVLGSRYGRSPPRTLAPRNDRFFMGSRYGKRSGPQPGAAPQSSPALLLCEYTGVAALYHCDARASLDVLRGLNNRKNDEESEGEEV